MANLKYLQRAGLVSVLLIVGVLIGLMAPLPSDAQTIPNATKPTLTIQIFLHDGTSPAGIEPITLGNPTTCLDTASFNYCYPITTYGTNATDPNGPQSTKVYGPTDAQAGGAGKGRQFKIVHDSTTSTPKRIARFNVNDKNSSDKLNPGDVLNDTGFDIVPTSTWIGTDIVLVKLVATQVFDAQPNYPAADGVSTFYPFGMKVGGTYKTSPTPVGNYYQMVGKGIFTPGGSKQDLQNDFNKTADFNLTPTTTIGAVDARCIDGNAAKVPMCRWIAGATTNQASFSSNQNSTYYPGGQNSSPGTTKFKCTNAPASGNAKVIDPLGNQITYANPSCQPTIELTHIFSILGPDIIQLPSSSIGGGGVCGDDKKLLDCATLSGAITAMIDKDNKKEKDLNLSLNIPEAIYCSTDLCNGTLEFSLQLTPLPPFPVTLPFLAAGPGVHNFSITVNPDGTLDPPDTSFVNLITGHGGADGGGVDIIITPDYDNWPRPDLKSWFQVDQMLPTSANGSTIVGTDIVVDNCPGGNKGPETFHFIGHFDSVTNKIHVHNSQSPPIVCPQ